VLENNQWGLFHTGFAPVTVKTLLSCPRLRHPEPDCGRQRRARRLRHHQRRGRRSPRRTRPCSSKAKTMRMKGQRSRPRRIRAQGNVRILERPRPAHALRKYLTENNIWDTKKNLNRRAHRSRIGLRAEVCRRISTASARACAQGVLLRRGLFTPITADWQRPKKELTPPNCSVEALGRLEDLGHSKNHPRGETSSFFCCWREWLEIIEAGGKPR